MTNYQFVDSFDTLPSELSSRQQVGVDTEFMREKTFFAQLCLVQVSTPDRIYFADPLDGGDLSHFWDGVLDKTWVLHSARQDIEVVSQTAGKMPGAIFDTQIAAALLGLAPQLGYASLVKELFGVEIPKSHTRADWTRRPLSEGLLHYAAEDVEYLLPAQEILCERLQGKDRMHWAEEDSAALLNPSLYAVDPAQAISRLKGARNLRGPARAAAERLAAWRENEALERDRPRQWIARDRVLMELATRRPKNLPEMKNIDGVPPKLVQRSGRELLGAVSATSSAGNGYRPPAPPDEAQKALLKEMQGIVAGVAKELDVTPEVIASKKELSAVIIDGNHDSRLFSGWRKALVGDQLEKML